MDAIVVDGGGLPAGQYSCQWSGYVATVNYEGKAYQVKTNKGLRGTTKAVVFINEGNGGLLKCR